MVPKFRAWDNDNKEMLEVENIDFVNETLFLRREAEFSTSWVELDLNNVTLMQSTGLHDVNGKEIFEGDIVRAEHENFSMDEVPPEYKPYVGFIKYVNTGYSIITKDTYHPCLSNIRITNIEVLGNIHEHPELLENI